jgi:hypothetical protein
MEHLFPQYYDTYHRLKYYAQTHRETILNNTAKYVKLLS